MEMKLFSQLLALSRNYIFSWRQSTEVFIARSKLWSTSQRHTVSESTAMSFIRRQYSWDCRHESSVSPEKLAKPRPVYCKSLLLCLVW